MRRLIFILAVLVMEGLSAGPAWSQGSGPIVPSPYEAVDGWLKPFDEGFTFGGNVSAFPESPDRIFILQRGSTRLPDPVPTEYAGFAGSIGMSPQQGEGRVWRNVIFVVDGDGNMIETWDQWDHLFEGTDGVGPHRVRISPYDSERRVWVIHETSHRIFVFSNDGSELLMELGEKNVGANDETHFGRPQDVAFLPDGRILVGDGLDNSRVVILDAEGIYLTHFGEEGDGPGQFNSVHGLATGPDGLIYVADRDAHEVEVFRVSSRASGSNVEQVAVWTGFELPLDIIVSGDDVWVSDLGSPKVIKFDTDGNRQYTWYWPSEGPARFREMHTMIVDSDGNLYGSDNQLGRTQKLLPRAGADPRLLIGQPFVAAGSRR